MQYEYDYDFYDILLVNLIHKELIDMFQNRLKYSIALILSVSKNSQEERYGSFCRSLLRLRTIKIS